MGKIVSFSNQKGGVGKTTTCVNMAAYIAEAGKTVLLVDIDPQGNATTGMGLSKSSLKKSMYSVIIDDEKASDHIVHTEIPGLDLLPSNIDLAGAEVELVYKKNREKVLKNALAEVKDKYDYILIDCPPSLGLLTIKGKNLHMNRLTLEKGEADLEGQIDSLAYSSNESLHKSGESLFNRLFR